MHYALHFNGDDVTDLSVEVRASILLVAENFVQATWSARFNRMQYFYGLGRPCACVSEPVLQADEDAREHGVISLLSFTRLQHELETT
jgi:hypothetical protein